MAEPALTLVQIDKLLLAEFPQAYFPGCGFSIENVTLGACRVRQAYNEKLVRPGGTISGPTMMALADLAMYVAVFSVAGAVPLAVTTNLTINFLRRPGAADLIGEARLLKAGKRLVVGEVTIYSHGQNEPVAHVTATYSIPPAK